MSGAVVNGKELMLGNYAVARGAFDAGVMLVSSYPGTPSTEITEYMAQFDGVFVEWAPNEKVSVEVALGASIGGGRALSAMKHVGLNVAADPLFTASYTGVNAGLVICVADDPGMHSSQNEQDSRNYAYAAKVPMLEPADSAECYEYARLAFDMSEDYDTPMLLRLSTRISHSQSIVDTGAAKAGSGAALKKYEKNPAKYVMMPAMARARHEFVCERTARLTAFAESTPLNRTIYFDKKIGVIAAGIAYQTAREALGENASYLKLGMVYPMPEELIRKFAAEVEICYVIEELDPFIENHCKQIGVKVLGKELFSPRGEYTVSGIRNAVLGTDEQAEPFKVAPECVPGRPPVMCAGCSHRGVFHVLNKLGVTVCGDIGCYTLGALQPLSAMDTCVCMGASIGMAHGMDIVGKRKSVGVIGDSTFVHSGITGLIDIVYNKGTSTVIILDNSITGMTGHQQNPTTGKTVRNAPTKALNLVKLCEAVGVERIRVIDPFETDELTQAVREELSVDEPSVIIAQRPCALLKKADKTAQKEQPRPLRIDRQKCKNCGLCLKIGCPAISKAESTVVIDPAQCNGCGFCPNVCKFNAILEGEGGSGE